MSRRDTLGELFAFTAWARDGLLGLAAPLSDAQLDQPFEMGEGALRATLRHLYGSERLWYERWRQAAGGGCDHPHARELATVTEIRAAHTRLSAARDGELARLADSDLDQIIRYVAPQDGQPRAYPLGRILLHVVNHGVHHRAQAVNMLRHVGGETPKWGLDYIFMKVSQQQAGGGVPPALDLVTIRDYYRYSDWSRARVFASAARLTDEQLERPFEMGSGTLRATLTHLRDAEQWWYQNWTAGPGQPFPAPPAGISVAKLAREFEEIVAARAQFLAGLMDGDLQRPIGAEPRPGRRLEFPLGVTLLQLCTHGTHHRAQALNMLRHVGGEVPALDFVMMMREEALATESPREL